MSDRIYLFYLTIFTLRLYLLLILFMYSTDVFICQFTCLTHQRESLLPCELCYYYDYYHRYHTRGGH